MKLILIAAIGRNRELGKKNELIWKLPDDLYRFSVMTRDKMVVMGKKTYDSLPKALERRRMVVLSRTPQRLDDAVVLQSPLQVIEYAASKFETEIYVIGGAQIYAEFLHLADELDLTLIDAEDSEADTFFPEFEQDFYCRQSVNMRDIKEKINYKFTRWSRQDSI